jgi:hypothetical protein
VPARRVATAALTGVLLLVTACGSQSAPAEVRTGADRSATTGTGCPPPDADGNAAVDWIDVVVVDGRQYSYGWQGASSVPADQVGPVVAEVGCGIADSVHNPDFHLRDGDATFLPTGTTLHRFADADPDLRLAARVDGEWRVYEVVDVPGARTGADLLDLGGDVRGVDLLSGEDGSTVVASVDDPEVVGPLVDAVLSAKAQADPSDDLDSPEFVRFRLSDGTTVTRAWFRAAGVLSGRLQVGDALSSAFPQRAG